jgi:hypothetical protein
MKVALVLLVAFYALFAFIIFNAWLIHKIVHWMVMRDIRNERRAAKEGKGNE